jgi:hypothetical protein
MHMFFTGCAQEGGGGGSGLRGRYDAAAGCSPWLQESGLQIRRKQSVVAQKGLQVDDIVTVLQCLSLPLLASLTRATKHRIPQTPVILITRRPLFLQPLAFTSTSTSTCAAARFLLSSGRSIACTHRTATKTARALLPTSVE